MMIDSKAVVPAQPDRPQYGLMELALTRTYTRAKYAAAFGAQPPPFDPTKPIKRWLITDAVIGTTIYPVWDAESQSLGKIILGKQEAAAVNIPGAYRYQRYVNDDYTPAVAKGFGATDTQPISGKSLVLKADVDLIVDEMRRDLSDITIQAVPINPTSGPSQIAWNGEPRRRYSIFVLGIPRMAESLVAHRYERGVGHPGRWVMDGAEPRFSPTQVTTEPPPNAEEIPVPLRALPCPAR
jgi:hypothetical protein